MGLALLFAKSAPVSSELAALKPPCRGPQQLEQDLRDCMADMRQNQLLFDMETEPELIDQRIYEYQAIQSRYRYLQRQARAAGLRAILCAGRPGRCGPPRRRPCWRWGLPRHGTGGLRGRRSPARWRALPPWVR